MTFQLSSSVLILLFSVLCASLFGGETVVPWSAFRGPKHDGVVRITMQPPAAWPKALKVVWEANIGAGFSSPITDGTYVFLQQRSDKEELIVAYDLATGKAMWRTATATFKESQTHDPAPTPLVSPYGLLFVHSLTGTVMCLDAKSGKQTWKRDLPSEWKAGLLGQSYGIAASPVFGTADTLVFAIGDKKNGKVLGLKTRDGSTAWEHATAAPGYSTFLPFTATGLPCIATMLYDDMVAYKKEGDAFKPAFSFPVRGGGDGNSSMPMLLGDNKLLITSLEATVALNILPGAATCSEAWRIDSGGDLSTPVCVNGRIYLHNVYELMCLNAADGKLLSKLAMDGQYCALLAWGDVLICRLHDGAMKFVDIKGETLKVLAAYPASDAPGESWSAPMPVSPTRIIVRSPGKLQCLTWE